MIAAMWRNSETIDVVMLIGLSLWSGYQNLIIIPDVGALGASVEMGKPRCNFGCTGVLMKGEKVGHDLVAARFFAMMPF